MRNMKDSGIAWIGEIPEDWEITRYKFYSKNRMGETILASDTVDQGVPVYSATQDSSIMGYIENPKILLKKGDFVIPARGNSIGCVSIVKEEIATCTQTTICCTNIQNIERKYLYFVCIGLKDYWFRYDGSAIPQVTVEQLKNNKFALPSKSTQQKIADYLDKKCAEIDKLIELQESMIAKLKEYKQSVITQAVTKGLDPDVPMKDSGIEWIGNIPEGWECCRIKNIADFNPVTKIDQGTDVVSYAPMDCVKEGWLIHNEINVNNVSTGLTLFQENDIVMAKVTPCFENGNIAIANGLRNGIAYGRSELFVFRSKNIYNNWLFYFLRNNIFKQKASSTMTGTGGLKRVSPKFVSNYPLAIPSLEEQQQIADYLDKKCAEIDNLIELKQQKIEKLKEYKKSLIYEHVTGKKEIC